VKAAGLCPAAFCAFGGTCPTPRFLLTLFFCCRQNAFFSCASGGPISFRSERNGGRNAAKNQWFLDFLLSLLMQWEKVPQGIGHGPTLAAADVVGS